MLIRAYTNTDREACLVVFKSNVPRFFAPRELKDFISWLHLLATEKTRESFYYVVEKDTQCIACGGFHLDKISLKATMVWGMVHQSFHRQGIGQKLLNFRIHQIQKQEPKVRIVLDTTQHSYRFFQKLGFTVTKITHNYYAPGLDRYDMES